MTPRPTFQRAYSQVPPQPERNAAPAYTIQGGFRSTNSRVVIANPASAETVCTNNSMWRA